MQQEKANARVFTLTKTDAEGNPSVISGALSISKTHAYVLIDLGSTHSFASPAFIRKIKNVPDIINRPFSVTVPLDETLNSEQLIKACEVGISGNTLCVDLIILEMHDYDVILSMDLLSKHYAKIDYKKNEVTFRPPQKESFTFKGECKENRMPIISALKVARLLNGGCEGYLASVVIETEEQKPKLEDILVMNEFHEVFSEGVKESIV